MRNKILTAFATVWVLVLALTACQNPQMVAYKSLAATGYLVDGTMKAYARAVVDGHVSTNLQVKIADLHDNKFNPAYRAALVAARFDYKSPTPGNVADLASQIVSNVTVIALPERP